MLNIHISFPKFNIFRKIFLQICLGILSFPLFNGSKANVFRFELWEKWPCRFVPTQTQGFFISEKNWFSSTEITEIKKKI